MTPSPGVQLTAPAKLTLSLRVTGARSDGYHLLDAEMVTVDLADTLEISAGDGLEVVDAMAAVGLPAGRQGEVPPPAPAGGQGEVPPPAPAGGDNLVCRALALAGRRAHVRLIKRIPAGAGLGGGSADAAAVLRWAGWGHGADDLRRAAEVGADVPFCLVGGRARVTGVGEAVEPLPFEAVDGQSYTLLIPPLAVSTAAVYRRWDEMGSPVSDGPNDLEPAALAVEPRLAEWRDRLGESTGLTPVLAGSGSTWFVPGCHPGEGRVVVRVRRR